MNEEAGAVYVDAKLSKGKPDFVLRDIETGVRQPKSPRKFKFTTESIKRLRHTAPHPDTKTGGQRNYWDSELSGLVLTVGRRTKTFSFWRVNQIRIGRFGDWTVAQARAEALRLKVEYDKGNDPVADKRRGKEDRKRKQEEHKAKQVTLQQAFEAYMSSLNRASEKTRHDYELTYKACLADWGDQPITDIKSRQIEHMHDRLKGKNGWCRADEAMRLLGVILDEASERYRYPDDSPILKSNPVKSVMKKLRRQMMRRDGYIKDGDLPSYFKGLEEVRHGTEPTWAALGCDLLLFLTYTGLRLSEATCLEWDRVKLFGKEPHALITERKNRRDHVVPLTEPLVRILERRQAAAGDSRWAFPAVGNRNLSGHVSDPEAVKKVVCERAEIPWFTNHDLRRTFIRAAYRVRVPEFEWKLLLGHQVDDNVTHAYVVDIEAEELRPSMDLISAYFEDMRQKGLKMREVYPFPTEANR